MHRSRRHYDQQADIIAPGSKTYDNASGEWTQTDATLWSGKISVQPYIRTSRNAVQTPIGGIALDIDAFTVLIPPDAPIEGRSDFRIAVGSDTYVPQHEPLNPGGQGWQWVVICEKAR